jgi:hypothetical protein
MGVKQQLRIGEISGRKLELLFQNFNSQSKFVEEALLQWKLFA